MHIQATFNNTIISIADRQGNVIVQASPGSVGFSGSKNPRRSQLGRREQLWRDARDYGMQSVDIYVKGPGSGRESAIRAIQAAGLMVTTIRDVTPMPHNGCRPRKKRRV